MKLLQLLHDIFFDCPNFLSLLGVDFTSGRKVSDR